MIIKRRPRNLITRGFALGVLVLISGLFAIAQSTPANQVDVLKVAHDLGAHYLTNKYVYPKTNLPAGTKTVDCTEFTLAVVKKLIPNLSVSAQKRLVMSDLDGDAVRTNKDGIITGGTAKQKVCSRLLSISTEVTWWPSRMCRRATWSNTG